MKKLSSILFMALGIISCQQDNEKADGYGNFEATEITISSEANGKIEFLKIEEGDVIPGKQLVGLVDTLQLHFAKQQLMASKITIASKSSNVVAQTKILQEQLKTAQQEKNRINNLYAENAATKRQVDDIAGQVKVIEAQIKSVATQNEPILNDLKAMDIQIAKITDQIAKCKIYNPINGTVLTKFAEQGEITAFGKPLYKIANLSEMILKMYISETQLSKIKIGEKVTVKIDADDNTNTLAGTISWIASTAEFTPKIIQTKEERVHLVYAVKVKVKNNGRLKIGMPAEMWLK